MATRVQIEKNKSRRKLVERYAGKRRKLKADAKNPKLSAEDRFQARLKLAELPRNSAPNRVRNRCELTGRSRSVYRKFNLSRLKLRELASNGQIPGAVKASW